jgi:phosphoadenosine phosphosulfate reductase
MQAELSLETKIRMARLVIVDALSNNRRPAILWSGGKSSLVLLHLVKSLTDGKGLSAIPLLLIDHGQHFEETLQFSEELRNKWNLTILTAKNENVIEQEDESNIVVVAKLDQRNQERARSFGFKEDRFNSQLISPIANHLLKEVALDNAVSRYRFDCLLIGDRWSKLGHTGKFYDFVSFNADPAYSCVRPILTFTDTNVWNYINQFTLSVNPLYKQGYRTVEGIYDSEKGEQEANKDDTENETRQRIGSLEDENLIRERLKQLGYE